MVSASDLRSEGRWFQIVCRVEHSENPADVIADCKSAVRGFVTC